MRYMTADEIRDTWLNFFAAKGHYIEPSASLIPHNDPTLLWINSGVAALKKYFDGTEQPPHRRLANVQKAIRTNDIDNVGKTARHHTFFEMMGNFSIGDYFRDEIIPWAYELLTSESGYGFPVEKLFVTYHPSDLETRDLWIRCGLPSDHLVPLESNFWEVGPGPCGPDTEIYFDRGEKYDPTSRGIKMLQNDEENDRYIEIWNIVFSQYDAEPGVKPRSEYRELPQKNIDTGGGFERFVCVLQQAETNYDTDLFRPYIEYLASHAAFPYAGEHRGSYQIIADHIRSLTFALSDGAVFSNEGRGYVLRRLVRRLVRQAQILKIDFELLPPLVDMVAENMKHFYPYLLTKAERVKKMIASEIKKFSLVLEDGEKRVGALLKNCTKVVPGDQVFALSDTYGIPFDLTVELAEAAGKTVDRHGYDEALKHQKDLARQARGEQKSFGQQSVDLLSFTEPSTFIYDEVLELKARVIGLFQDGVKVEELGESGEVIFDKTTFYAESGGQVADTGTFKNLQCEAEVRDVTKAPHKQFLHHVDILYGTVKIGDEFTLYPDYERRHLTMKNHSSAHLLQRALQEILGADIHQEGSFVSPDEVRFDFNCDFRISSEQLLEVEARVNQIIADSLVGQTEIMAKEEALKTGAMALFDEKYDDQVRVVSFGDYSKEFCAGTHVKNTADLLQFVIVSCQAVAAGIKRITAYTGYRAYQYRAQEEQQLTSIAALLELNSRKEIVSKLRTMKAQHQLLAEREKALEDKIASLLVGELSGQALMLGDLALISACLDDLTHDQLLQIVKILQGGVKRIIFLVSRRRGKSELAVGISHDLLASGLKAGELVKQAAAIMGGSGGGKPDLAFGGAIDTSSYPAALEKMKEELL